MLSLHRVDHKISIDIRTSILVIAAPSTKKAVFTILHSLHLPQLKNEQTHDDADAKTFLNDEFPSEIKKRAGAHCTIHIISTRAPHTNSSYHRLYPLHVSTLAHIQKIQNPFNFHTRLPFCSLSR